MSKKIEKARAAAMGFALALPGAWEDHPWEETVVKVNKKIFVFFGRDDPAAFGLSVKLPDSGPAVLMLETAEPTGYGMGKAGWVTVRFTAKDLPPSEVIEDWIEESYRAVAPKRLAAQLDDPRPVTAPKGRGTREPSGS